MDNIFTEIYDKQQKLNTFQPFPVEVIEKLDKWCQIELSYTSCQLEGSSLNRAQIKTVVEKNLSVDGKSIAELQMAVNHGAAWDLIKQLAISKTLTTLTEDDIKQIHRTLWHNLDQTTPGTYRSEHTIQTKMSSVIKWLGSADQSNVVQLASGAHLELSAINPFEIGSNAVGRMLMSLILIQLGYPPALIYPEDENRYLEALGLGPQRPEKFYQLVFEAADHSFDVFLKMVSGKSHQINKPARGLLKIGQVAKMTGNTVPTIRFWTNEGLLTVKAYSQGGYQLYDKSMVEKANQIRQLQQHDRLSIKELKKRLAR